MKARTASLVALLLFVTASCSSTGSSSTSSSDQSSTSVHPPGPSVSVVAPDADIGTVETSHTEPASSVEVPVSVTEQSTIKLFADHERWVAYDLDGRAVVDGPTIESARRADFTPPDRLGQIAGCVLNAGSYGFNLDQDKLIADSYANIDFDCDYETAASQVDTIRELVFNEPRVSVSKNELQLTKGINTLSFRPESSR